MSAEGRRAAPAPDLEGSDAVAEAQRWLSERGLPAPDAVSLVGTPGFGRGTRAKGGGAEEAGVRAPTGDSGPRPRRSSRRRSGARVSEGTEPRSAARSRLDPPEAQDPEELARAVVLRKLSGQARTRHELDRALRSKQVPETVANGVLDRMEEIGLVDDAAFARDWVESRQQRRQLSRRALRNELQTKGVDRDQIEDALSTVDSDDEYLAATALAERRLRSMTGLGQDVCRRRLAGALARRGFSPGVASRVISAVLSAAEPWGSGSAQAVDPGPVLDRP